MNFIFLFFLFLVFVSGVVILLGSLSRYTSYAETEGEVIEELKCNPGEEDEIFGKGKKGQEEAVVVAYKVGGKTYHLATNYKKSHKESLSPKGIRILYNPYFPGESRIKEGSPVLGPVLIVASMVGLVLVAFLF